MGTVAGAFASCVAEGRAHHTVRAADSNPFAERRARSDAPYLVR